MGKMMRLDKFLADMGRGSRSEIKEMARRGRIFVNGCPEGKPDRKVDPERDVVAVDGCAVAYAAFEYFMLYKPSGVITATEDRRHGTVMDFISSDRRDLFPVGRLDIDTEGLLLITNDGDLAHRLLAPKRHVDKVYLASVAGTLPENAVERFSGGLTLEDGTAVMPAGLEVMESFSAERTPEDPESMKASSPQERAAFFARSRGEILCRLTIREGKFHQVKRMFEAVGCHVTYLMRLSMGPLVLDPALRPGEFRPLTEEEISLLSGAGGAEHSKDNGEFEKGTKEYV